VEIATAFASTPCAGIRSIVAPLRSVNLPTKILVLGLAAAAVVSPFQPAFAAKASSKGGRVTQIIQDVKLLPSGADPHAAAINDRVTEDTGVRTGDQSRSELTFTDLTIERIGANSVFSFNKAGRSVDLGGGSVLLRVPKDSGGANIKAPAVSVAVTGTTLILEAVRGGRSRLIVLEGSARLGLVKYPAQTRNVLAGQMLNVPAGATTLPNPENIDLNQVMNSHPLIVGFPPLPSQKLISEAAKNPRGGAPNEPVYQGQPVSGGVPGLTGGIGLPGLTIPPFFGGSGNIGNPGGGRPNNPKRGDTETKGQTKPQPKPTPRPGRSPNSGNNPG
jgi:hypothetical protein